MCKEIEPVALRLYGASGFELTRDKAYDPREMLTVSLSVSAGSQTPDADALLERLGGA